MIVMDEDTCMVEVSRYFVNFLFEESCGQCTPCREGLIRMKEILTRITRGEGREGDVELLVEIGNFTNNFSLCGLGTSAANPYCPRSGIFAKSMMPIYGIKNARRASANPCSIMILMRKPVPAAGSANQNARLKPLPGRRKRHMPLISLCASNVWNVTRAVNSEASKSCDNVLIRHHHFKGQPR